MSLESIRGDLLDFTNGINVIAHCCNDQRVMGSGIALGVKTRYPAAYEAYMKGSMELGTFSYADVAEGRKVVNLIGQHKYRTDPADKTRYLDYEGLYRALATLHLCLEDAHKEGRVYTLGVPYKMGADRAGGSWRIIEAMLADLFDKSPVRCVIVKLPDKPSTP
jgi:hypothetical protein